MLIHSKVNFKFISNRFKYEEGKFSFLKISFYYDTFNKITHIITTSKNVRCSFAIQLIYIKTTSLEFLRVSHIFDARI